MPLQIAAVQRPPPPIERLDLRRDHCVGVQLRVIGTGRGLTERGHRQAVRVREHPIPVHPHPCRRAIALQVRERRAHGLIVHVEEPGVTGEGPQHTHRLRRRERRIKPRHRPHHRTIRPVAVNQRLTQRCPQNRVTALQHRLQHVAADFTGEAELVGLRAGPHTRHLPRRLGQVLRVVRRRRRGRRGVQRRHPQHHNRPAGTCLPPMRFRGSQVVVMVRASGAERQRRLRQTRRTTRPR